MATNIKEFVSPVKPDWCPGCGDYGVLNALQRALSDLDIQPHNVMVVSGIGCSSNLPGFIRSYGFHSLHGRSLPVATGAKLANLIKGAIEHKGFALVDVFSPCVTYNKHNTYPWFKERCYKLEDEKHDPANFQAAMEKAFEWGARIPIGLFYKVDRPTYEDEEPALRSGTPLVKQPLQRTDLPALMEEFL